MADDTQNPQSIETEPPGDDRRSTVNPADDPRPQNPPVDEEAVRKGEEVLGRVKPY